MSIEDYAGTRSTIIDEGTPPPSGNIAPDSIFIFGVAEKGPVGQPIWPGQRDVREIFGEVRADQSFDMSLVRGYYEISQSSRNQPNVALVRVGTTSRASVNLYEAQLGSGDLQPSTDASQEPAIAITISSISEGTEFNGTRVTVTKELEDDYPVHMRIELPTGESAGFNLSSGPGAPGTYYRVSGLVNAINVHPELSGKITASYTPIEANIKLEIQDNGNGGKETVYNLSDALPVNPHDTNLSYGDKMVDIRAAFIAGNVVETVPVGSLNFNLSVTPEKEMEGDPTIDKFVRLAEMEAVLTVTANNAGQTNPEVSLYCTRVNGWNNAHEIDDEFELYVRRSGSTTPTKLGDDKFTVNNTTGKVTILETLKLGDRYFANYEYQVNYTEAKLKSELVVGSDRSYFIKGDMIVFGADQPSPVRIEYEANSYLDGGDIRVLNRDIGEIEFTNPSALPDISGWVSLTIRHEPELPAASGSIIHGSYVQPAALSGGKDGRRISKKEYAKAVKAAMESVDIYPRRSVVVMGLWMDEVAEGYNEETGLPEVVPLNMFTDIVPYIERSSKYTNECELNLPVLPPRGMDLSQSAQNNWIDRLINTSATDRSRPANIIEGINNFRIQAPVGALVGSHPNVNGGRRYMFNPACVFAAVKGDLPYNESAMKSPIPGNIKDLGVKIYNADVIGALNSKRYTAATVNIQGQFIWEDTPTLAIRNRSVYDRQFVRDTVYLAVSMARDVAQKYIGKPRKAEYIVSMRKDIGKALEMLVPDVLSDIFIKVIPVADGYITGRTKIRMILETVKETRVIDIETVASLSAVA